MSKFRNNESNSCNNSSEDFWEEKLGEIQKSANILLHWFWKFCLRKSILFSSSAVFLLEGYSISKISERFFSFERSPWLFFIRRNPLVRSGYTLFPNSWLVNLQFLFAFLKTVYKLALESPASKNPEMDTKGIHKRSPIMLGEDKKSQLLSTPPCDHPSDHFNFAFEMGTAIERVN